MAKRVAADSLDAQLEMVRRHLPVALVVNVVNSLIVTGVFATTMPETSLGLWLGSILGLSGLRATLQWRGVGRSLGHPARRLNELAAGAALSGSLWGIGLTVLFPEPLLDQLFIAFVLGGMAAGAVVTFAPALRVCLAFLGPCLLPLAARLAGEGSPVYLAMAGLVLVFGAALTGVAWLLNRWIRSNLELQAEKTELARELTEALASLERRVEERTVALRHALADKELLLREMNHRVKNSLQLVASMLSLREHLVSDPTARAHLAETQAQVESIARVHQHLYQKDEIGTVEFGHYLRDLCADLSRSLGNAQGRTIRVEAATVELPVDQAISLALIATELITNALKYAYPPGQPGTIDVRFAEDEGANRRLIVSDTGVGLRDDVEPEPGSGFGMTLVSTLVQQLRGQIRADRTTPGCRFVISVPG